VALSKRTSENEDDFLFFFVDAVEIGNKNTAEGIEIRMLAIQTLKIGCRVVSYDSNVQSDQAARNASTSRFSFDRMACV
jgi:hypothetical protein